jgi:WD40 repeat protein
VLGVYISDYIICNIERENININEKNLNQVEAVYVNKIQRFKRVHSDCVKFLLFFSDNYLLGSGRIFKLIILWETTKWEIKHKLKLHGEGIQDLKYSLDSKVLIFKGQY